MDSDLQTRFDNIFLQIAEVCRHVGRSAGEVTVVAITKTFPSSYISNAHALGLRHVGENRAQELIDKFGDKSPVAGLSDLTVHFVGHLQSNKVRKVIPLISCLDSVDSRHLAEGVSRVSGELGRSIRVLLEVNTSGEPQKYGISPDDVLTMAEGILPLPHLQLAGLMTVGPNVEDESVIHRSFALLRDCFNRVKVELNPPHWSVLSMGMSGDFPIAIEEGATEIRLGTALFGARG